MSVATELEANVLQFANGNPTVPFTGYYNGIVGLTAQRLTTRGWLTLTPDLLFTAYTITSDGAAALAAWLAANP